ALPKKRKSQANSVAQLFLSNSGLVALRASSALRIPTIQTSRTPIHQHQRLRAALVAHGRGRRKTRAVAGDCDVFFVVGGGGGAALTPALSRLGGRGGRARGHVRVFF